jgi:hypothetical protein
VNQVCSDTVVATVTWWLNELLAIVLIRRKDCGMAFTEIPEALLSDLVRLDREAVLHHGEALRQAVIWFLPGAIFVVDDEVGASSLRDGATPAELGSIRRFQTQAIGIDIGEFDLPERGRAH